MAASDHLHPRQLKLFMSGTEWKNSMTSSVDRWGNATMDDVWRTKLDEAKAPKRKPSGAENYAHGAGTYDSIKTHGFDPGLSAHGDQPTIRIRQDNSLTQDEGHHRIAAAAELERETGKPVWIPTNYVKNRGE